MTHGKGLQEVAGAGGWEPSTSDAAQVPSLPWIPGWALLTTAALPIASVLAPPIAAGFLLIFNAAARAGLRTNLDEGPFITLGFLLALSLTMGTFQWLLLRDYLSQAKRWILFTGLGWLAGAVFVVAAVVVQESQNIYLGWGTAWFFLLFVLFGSIVGLVQWLYLRRVLPGSGWWILVCTAASASLLLVGRSITNLLEMLVLFFPGAVMGLGLWILLRLSPNRTRPEEQAIRTDTRKIPRPLWIGLGLVSLIPLFFIGIWIYAVSQIALAKQDGVYPTPQDAIAARLGRGWGGAEVVKLEMIHATPNSMQDGSLPHVWFGGARVYLDRIPIGGTRDTYSAGSFYVRVTDGWVHMSEGAFPQFIGWVMELYNLEGTGK